MMATWVQVLSTTLISWVMMTMVMPILRLISRRRLRIEVVVVGSSALVASSQRMIFGLVARARAMATRCCWPPESWLG